MFFQINAINETASGSIANIVLPPEVNGVIVGLLLLVIAILVLWKLRQLIINSVLGIIALFLLGFLGIQIPINAITLIVAAALGLVGVGLMVLLKVMGFAF